MIKSFVLSVVTFFVSVAAAGYMVYSQTGSNQLVSPIPVQNVALAGN